MNSELGQKISSGHVQEFLSGGLLIEEWSMSCLVNLCYIVEFWSSFRGTVSNFYSLYCKVKVADITSVYYQYKNGP